MNLLYDHQIFAMQRYGGVSRYYYELISRICKRDDVDLSLFLGAHVNEYGLERFRSDYLRFWGWKHRPVVGTASLFSLFNRVLFRALFAPDEHVIYHQTYYGGHHATSRCKRVVTVYDMIHEHCPGQFPLRDRTIAAKKEAVSRADAVICISRSTRSDLLRYYQVPDDRIKVIHLANSLNSTADFPKVVDAPYILYVGQRGGYKNFDILLSAYASLERIKKAFFLICFGGGAFTRDELSRFRSLGIETTVQYHSGSDEALAACYHHAAVFVYPSLFEGFGIPPLEAMHYGCPVLASRSSSIPEVVGEAGRYFDPEDLDDLRTNLLVLLQDDTLRAGLSRLGFEREKLFSWDRCASETMDCYRQL